VLSSIPVLLVKLNAASNNIDIELTLTKCRFCCHPQSGMVMFGHICLCVRMLSLPVALA